MAIDPRRLDTAKWHAHTNDILRELNPALIALTVVARSGPLIDIVGLREGQGVGRGGGAELAIGPYLVRLGVNLDSG